MSKSIIISDSVLLNPSGYTNLTSLSTSSNYPISNGYDGSSSTSYARFSLSSKISGYIYYTFDIPNIPSDATITSVTGTVKAYVSSTSRVLNTICQLFSETTAKGSNVTFASTSSSNTVTLSPGSSWTVSELSDLRLKIGGTGSSSSSSSRSRYIYFCGADITINYSVDSIAYEITSTVSTDKVNSISPEGYTEVLSGGSYELQIYTDYVDKILVEDNGVDVTNQLVLVQETGETTSSYYTYTLTNVSADHTVLISNLIIPIPDEDPLYNYYPITISSANATTTPERGTIRVVEGTNQTIRIYPSDPSITLVTDNGVDITNQLVAHDSKYPTYTVTSQVSGASYGFTLNDDTGYYTSNNAGVASSAAVCRVNLDLPVKCLVTFEYINYAEATYDYGIFSKVDTSLSTESWSSGDTSIDAGLEQIRLNTAEYNIESAQTLTYEIEAGSHYIDIKFGKDYSVNKNNDNLQWKITNIEMLEVNNYYTYTLNDINDAHSLIFIFGDITYYFINSSASNAKLYPSGSIVQLPGETYRLTVVPDNYSYNLTLKDNNIDRTSSVVKKEEQVTKDGQTYTIVNYVYTLSNVQASHTIEVVCYLSNTLYIKVNGNYITASKLYKKISGAWVEQIDYLSSFNENEVYVQT